MFRERGCRRKAPVEQGSDKRESGKWKEGTEDK